MRSLAGPLLALAAAAAPLAHGAEGRPFALPADHRTLARTTTFAEMESLLRDLAAAGAVELEVVGTSVEGRPLYSVHLARAAAPSWRVLLYARQHGDEVSGTDALLYLLRDLARDPGLLPADVDLWVVPMVNPDGAVADTRENAAGADLNRDHLALAQPETAALHRLARRLLPQEAVDCHEFARDPSSYRERGWEKWPDITLDSVNNPLLDREVRALALRRLDLVAAAEAAAGHPFLRYWVGGLPPDEEQRHSAPDVDGGLNGLGMYGGLSFIAEAAARHDGAGRRDDDLGHRVDAYLVLLRSLLAGGGDRRDELAAVAAARQRPLPPFLPTNYLWVNPEAEVTGFPVVEAATGRVVTVPTANMMTVMAVKRTVPTPLGYAVAPAAAAAIGAALERHGVPFETLAAPRPVMAETCRLLRLEEDFDEVHGRYEGRQVVERGPAAAVELSSGSLWVPLAGEAAVRAALVLEPAALYGLYQYPAYRALVAADGALPVLRVVR